MLKGCFMPSWVGVGRRRQKTTRSCPAGQTPLHRQKCLVQLNGCIWGPSGAVAPSIPLSSSAFFEISLISERSCQNIQTPTLEEPSDQLSTPPNPSMAYPV